MNTRQQPLFGHTSKSYSIKPVYLLLHDSTVIKRLYNNFGREQTFELQYDYEEERYFLHEIAGLTKSQKESHFEVLLGGILEAKKIVKKKHLESELECIN
ncbi:MAG: hypothetical protein VXZ40_00670 [Nanoarchaeota archaeon]|nr:hypothetical protein [Nanoarchaeota archaeon]